MTGNVNDGTLVGGNWRLVRRLAIPSDLKEVEERVVVFPSSPMGIGIYTSAAVDEASSYSGAIIGSVSPKAASLGCVEGSQIISVNGVDVSERTFEEMRPLLDRAKWPLKMILRLPNNELRWHEASDSLRGLSSYNETKCFPSSSSSSSSSVDEDAALCPHSFSRTFNFSDVKEYLFSTGDGERWAIVSKSEFETFRKEVQSVRFFLYLLDGVRCVSLLLLFLLSTSLRAPTSPPPSSLVSLPHIHTHTHRYDYEENNVEQHHFVCSCHIYVPFNIEMMLKLIEKRKAPSFFWMRLLILRTTNREKSGFMQKEDALHVAK